MPDNLPLQHGFSARRLVPLGLLVAAGVAFMAAGGRHYVTFAALAEHRGWLCRLVARWGVAAALLYSVAYACLVALSLPGGAVMTIAGGFLFGTWVGGMCAVVGATLGATALFLAARAGLGPNTIGGLAPGAGPLFGKLEAGFRAHAFSYLLALRLMPLFPFWLINLVPALVGVGLPTYLLATFIGIIPATFVYASLGNGFSKVVETPDASILFRPGVLLPILALAVLALVPVWYKRWRRRPTA
ncbi:MAG: TVP38/TMEM64 family protein [Stellaceae bacterium]